MIFQANIDLEVPDKDIHAVIDFDTGLIGFTERVGEKEIEYSFYDVSAEYKIALFNKLEPILSSNQRMNLKICRKTEAANLIRKALKET